MNYYFEVLKKYAVFSGRSTISEYWYFLLFNIIISIVLDVANYMASPSLMMVANLYGLAVLIPGIAVGVRRLHDIGKSGWYMFISLIPIIGIIWLIVLLATDSNPGDNKYGPNPKAAPVK